MTDVPQVETGIEEAVAGIGAARTLLAQDRMIDLAGLENYIATICDDLTALPAEQQQRLKPRLVSLIDDLGALANELTARHERTAAALKDRTAHQKALSAYGTGRDAPAPAPGGPAKKSP